MQVLPIPMFVKRPMTNPTDLLVWGVVAHVIGDWFLQNEFISQHKVKWNHWVSWLHSGIHFGLLLFVFPFWFALGIGIAHWLIDLRFILVWWRKTFKMTTEPPIGIHVAFWQDQAAHLLVLALAAHLCAHK